MKTQITILAALISAGSLLVPLHNVNAVPSVNLVVNPGFEILSDITVNPPNAELEINGDFPGWTVSNNVKFGHTGLTDFAHSGSVAAAFLHRTDDFGFISQDLVTIPGATYDLSFWIEDVGDFTAPEDLALWITRWDGNLVSFLGNEHVSGYTQFTYKGLSVTGPLTTLEFSFLTPNHWNLDDVSVTLNTASVPDSLSTLWLVPRITEPEKQQSLLLHHLGWNLPEQPPPRVYSHQIANRCVADQAAL